MVFCGLKQISTFASLSDFILHGRGSSVRLSLTCAMSSFSGSAGSVIFFIKLYLSTFHRWSLNFLKLTEIISRIKDMWNVFPKYESTCSPPNSLVPLLS